MDSIRKEFNRITNAYLDELAQSLGYCLILVTTDDNDNLFIYDYLELNTYEKCRESYFHYKKIDQQKQTSPSNEPTFFQKLRICSIDGIHKNTLRMLTREYLNDRNVIIRFRVPRRK